MVKKYILDTGILLASPQAINNFDEHDVILSTATIESLSGLRSAPGEPGANAREALRIIDAIREKGDVLPGGGHFSIEAAPLPSPANDAIFPWNTKNHENDVVHTASKLTESNGGKSKVILVSNSTPVRIKASKCGVAVESYRTEQVAEPMQQYKGRRELPTTADVINSMYSKDPGCVAATDVTDEELQPNEYLTLTDMASPSHCTLAQHVDGRILPLRTDLMPYRVRARNAGQRFAIDALMNPNIPLVILKGPAGTAKTFLSMAAGLEQTLNTHTYDRILVARPNTKFDDDIGYLKGTEEEKIGPLIRPVMDNLAFLSKVKGDSEKDGVRTDNYVQELFANGTISAQAMAYMRGRSIANTFILIDEAQNMNPTQALGIISRVGAGSKVVLAGDTEQIDSPELDSRNNGLSYASECMRGSPLCAQVAFEKDECVRSALALEAIRRMSGKITQN